MKYKKIAVAAIMMFCASLFFVTAVDAGTTSSINDLNTSIRGQVDAFGQEFGGDVDNTPDIRVVVARIIRIMLSLMSVVTISYIIYGGYMYMTSGGSDERIGKARKIIFYGAIGLGIMVSSFGITSFAYKMIYGATNPWTDGGNSSFDIYTQKQYNNGPPNDYDSVPDDYDFDWGTLVD